ncbi:MAG: LCP family protein [Clostridia bacterium]|nr:LCP family protein [Clostridia bacterium]
MSEKNNFGINFDDKYEEIIAAMQKKQEEEYEDIVSDSSLSGGKHIYEDISSSSKKKGFKAWWRHLTRGKKAALISATSVVLIIAILLGWFFSYFKYNYNSITTDPDELGFTNVKEKGVINVALFGVDSRDETVFKGNTDSIMILSLNTNTKKVKIFSVMRDTLVPMEYQGDSYFGKINSAYAKGPEHAIKTINQAFDLDISEYATVNFYGMTDIIDAVGGITATITQDELTWKGNDHPNLNNCMDEICKEMGLNAKDYYIHTSGEQTLNGVQAVAYARVRHCTTVWGTRDDFGRTDRQRHVMQELFNKAITMKKTQYVSLAKALIPCSETSLSYADIVGLATNILLSSPTFEQYRLPPSEYQSEFLMTSPSGYGSVIYYDLDYAAKMINAIIYDDVTMEQYIELNPIERNNWYYEMTGSSGRRPSNNTTSSQQTTTSSEPEESKPSDEPEELKPSSEPEESKPSSEPEESKPSSEPEESKPSSEPEESKPSDEPEESKPSSEPEESKPSSEPEESKPSSEPEKTEDTSSDATVTP